MDNKKIIFNSLKNQPSENGKFGGYDVNVLPSKHLTWYLQKSYGPLWKTHDGKGNKLENIHCALHTNMK